MVRIQLKNVRLSYANIWKAISPANDTTAEPKFSVALLMDKRDQKNVKMLQQAINETIEAGRGKLGNVNPRKLDKGVRDGDEKFVNETDDTILDGYEGHWYINAKAGENHPPQIVDNRRRPITEESKVYSGCFANVFIETYAYKNQGNAGVGFGLLGIQKTSDGEPLGSTFSSDLFDEFDAEYEADDDYGSQFDDFGGSQSQKRNTRNSQQSGGFDDDGWGDDGAEDFGPSPQRQQSRGGQQRQGQRSQGKQRTSQRQRQNDFDDFGDAGWTPQDGHIDISDDDLPF